MTNSKSIFITGASSGLGRAAALTFAKHGWTVYATMRRPEAHADLGEVEGVTLLPLDVTSPAQVEAAVARAIELGGVDVLFNNAGYSLAGPLEGASDAAIAQQFETNVFGVMRVTRALLPHLRERGGATIITTTSIGGHVAMPLNSAYHATKWALEGWSESLAFELRPFGIEVKTVAPGGIATDFFGRSMNLVRHPAYEDQLKTILAAFTSPERAARRSTAEAIAEVVYEAATDGEDKLRYFAGEDAKAYIAQRRELGDQGFHMALAKAMYGG
ncbi:SDR family oxidoreductase [Pseudenhygromyxa sp. WMMC2535]|uniref:SDR family oxidoreductase n=1 Tax=Pseudenhygromyxa sp. WMMC2535 TaxID=2712867 RepID=UPI001555C05C|nr:SDR family oxidoreductase [Pseudenhygromyxa sp. WMMC2535]NVB40675.1 SDR family oxidoreductase [Pseudenhygromyxa sp. WMMC2535]